MVGRGNRPSRVSSAPRIWPWLENVAIICVPFMSKDNLVFGLVGMILGIIVGVIIANYSGPRQIAQQAPQQMVTSSNPGQSAEQPREQGQLPDGHPPIDEGALKQQIQMQQEILKKDPENQQAIISVANLNFDLKSYEEAAKWYEKALLKDPKNVNLITDLGTCYLWLNQPQQAIEFYNKSLSYDPTHFQTLLNMGIARMSMGNRPGAAEAWEKLVTLYPEHPEASMLRDAIKKLRTGKEGT